ncbi:MAG: hypothetical protein JW759_01010 [Candidatus Coatesbacteria bacterium]|nr:hypothetical protein [Candidatus Coatesbacteria bacterium]
MRRLGIRLFLAVAIAMGLAFSLSAADPANLKLVPYNGGFFTISIPQGWQVITAGSCSTFAFVLRDPQNPLRQAFFFGQVGPVYISEQQRQYDLQYMAMGGYPIAQVDMPAVDPLTPGNFMANFSSIANSRIGQGFMPQCPRLDRFQLVSETAFPSFLPNGRTGLVRAVFAKDGAVAEGLFLLTVAQMLPMMGGPGCGIAYASLVSGITAPKREFASLEPTLRKSLESFTLTDAYVQNCMRSQAQAWEGVRKAGQTLRESSDILMKGWEERNKTYDIIAEKRSDAILGKERLYNPDTGEVYEFENGFYDKYDLHRQQYEMSNLQPLPDNNIQLWTAPTKDGGQHLH